MYEGAEYDAGSTSREDEEGTTATMTAATARRRERKRKKRMRGEDEAGGDPRETMRPLTSVATSGCSSLLPTQALQALQACIPRVA